MINQLSDGWLTMTTQMRDRFAHGLAWLSLRAWGQCDYREWQTTVITPLVVERDIERVRQGMAIK